VHPQALRVQAELKKAGCEAEVRELPDSTRTALEAAQAIGCEVAQIVKSLIFVLDPPGEPILVLASGVNRVHEKRLGRQLEGKLEKAGADQVQAAAGFAIGGVPPLGHSHVLATYIDEDLLQYPILWAAAGTPHAVFPIAPDELVRVTGGKVLKVT
jgi:prolyl-tRNA editing enzyme YbaK/EbsC (Cys-tRNA(Pro) deacylase)